MKNGKKTIYLLVIALAISWATSFLFPFGDHLLKRVRTHAYVYGYSKPDNLITDPFEGSRRPAAQGVPILMYHGIVTSQKNLGDNTLRENFIAQMEMLKEQGFETISVQEYESFREGKFTLPPKPIIITFDDGRKDSFYPVDDILKELGFQTAIFVATVKANENEQFYLGWDELRKAKSTGRWEIEAHGRRSHDEIIINESGDHSTYLTSRIFSSGQGLESEDDFKKRVEQDYIDGINDLKKNLDINPRYFAVPLNQYGKLDTSNFDGAMGYNMEMTRRYFDLAFVEVASNERMALESFYNYADSDPYHIRRLEVKNRSADDLMRSLNRFSPQKPALTMPNPRSSQLVAAKSVLLYGSVKLGEDGIVLENNSPKHPSARLLFGDWGWQNYSYEASVEIEEGHSVSLLAYYSDEDNYLSLNWGNESLFLNEMKEGKEREIASFYPLKFEGESVALISVRDDKVSISFDGQELVKEAPINLRRGAAGFGVWDPESAKAVIKKLEIKNL